MKHTQITSQRAWVNMTVCALLLLGIDSVSSFLARLGVALVFISLEDYRRMSDTCKYRLRDAAVIAFCMSGVHDLASFRYFAITALVIICFVNIVRDHVCSTWLTASAEESRAMKEADWQQLRKYADLRRANTTMEEARRQQLKKYADLRSARTNMTTEKRHFEDLSVGDRFTSRGHTLDASQIKAFARDFDPQPFHLDEAAAGLSFFNGLAASGWHTAAITMRLLVE
ncbi:MAG: hypothetical protein LBB51_00210, partial [Zoogloeaceae bacterium]|nr:hypothetical protein [Zoogloeaceae bacterium]